VTLTTTKHQECLTYLRPSWEGMSPDGKEILHGELLPDMPHDVLVKYPFYRAEPINTFSKLADVRPNVLWVYGEDSPLSTPEPRKDNLGIMGTGTGGSGGTKEGKVQEVVLKNAGHLVAMEATAGCAEASAQWIGKHVVQWKAERKQYEEWTKKSMVEKTTLSEEWKKRIGGPMRTGKL